jgi:hypothetical protein
MVGSYQLIKGVRESSNYVIIRLISINMEQVGRR